MTFPERFVFFRKKIWSLALLLFLFFSSFHGVLLNTASASDNAIPPCSDAKGTGTDVTTGNAYNAGKITFDPDGGPPDFKYQACVYDPGNDGKGPFEVHGWGWDDNLGWISFYCNNGQNLGIACGGQNYGVIIDGPDSPTYGNLHGYAWGDNVGWINTSCIAGYDIYNNHCGNVDYYVHAEETDAACLGKVYADIPPDASCLPNSPSYSVYGWADSVGWINFTGLLFPLTPAAPQLPPQVDVAVSFDPDPNGLNKNTALPADNASAYRMILTFTNKSDGSPINLNNYVQDHTISAQITWLEDSIDMDQTDGVNGNYLGCHDLSGPAANCSTSAVTKPLVFTDFSINSSQPNVAVASIQSMAPTSDMNGYDSNGDGVVEFPYEQFMLGKPQNLSSVPENHLRLGKVQVSVSQKTDGGCNFGDNAPNSCDLKTIWSGNKSFPFVPAIEVTKFDDEGKDYIETANSQIEHFNTDTACRGAMAGCNASIFFQLGFDTPNPPYKFVIDSNNDSLFSVADNDFFTIPGYGNFGPGSFAASPKSADPQMQAPADNAYVWTKVQYSVGNNTVSYFSNKLPRAAGSYLVNPLASIKGNAYSTGVTSPQGGVIIKPSGDVPTNILRDFIARNVSHIIAGADDPPEGNTSQLNSDGNGFSIVSGNGQALLPDDSNPPEPRVYYFKGDVVLDGNSDLTWNGERTIVTIGGNIFINKNLWNQNLPANQLKPQLGIIALKNFKTGQGGNVYIGPGVTAIQAQMFMDGSLYSYSGDKNQINTAGEPLWPDDKTRHDSLMNQLAIEGSVASLNTIGGALQHPPVLGNGTNAADNEGSYAHNILQNSSGRSQARLYDLNFLRFYGQVFERDQNSGDSVDQNGDKAITAALAPAGDLISPPDGIAQSSLILDPSQKFSTYILFEPASPTLPGFGVQGGLTIEQRP